MIAAQLALDWIKEPTPYFRNEFGEEFELDKINAQVGIMRGDETDREDVYLVNGYGLEFNLFSEDESSWLATHFDLDPPMYPDSEIKHLSEGTEQEGCSYLTGDLCPVCLEQKREFEIHHIIWAMLGGSDGFPNCIKICNSCHALETSGDTRHRYAIYHLLSNHQFYHYGIQFYLCQRYGNKRYKDRHISQWEEETPAWKIIKGFYKADGETFKKEGKHLDPMTFGEAESWISGRSLKAISKLKYHYFRQVFLGAIPWEYIENKVLE